MNFTYMFCSAYCLLLVVPWLAGAMMTDFLVLAGPFGLRSPFPPAGGCAWK